jgi:hypothetical protein
MRISGASVRPLALALYLLGAGQVQAQSLPVFAIPEITSTDRPNSEQAFAAVEIHERPAPVPLVFDVSPAGSDVGDGSAARPLATLARAQAGVRSVNTAHAVTVRLADGVYLDEGSRYVTVRDNVFDGPGLWVNLNALDGPRPRRTAADNVARGNRHNAGKANGSWSDYANNRLIDNVPVEGQAWPKGARGVIARAGPASPP